MHHYNYHINEYLLVLMMIFVSCNRDSIDIVELGDNSSSVPMQIKSSSFPEISFSTRSETIASDGDMGIFRLESAGYTETRSNVQYTYDGSNWNVVSGVEPISLTESNANLCVYSPFITDESTITGETLTLNSQLYDESADLCYQSNITANSETSVSFTLSHAYAEIVFNLTRYDTYTGECAISKISIANDGILVSNTLDISTGDYGSGTVGTVEIDPEISSISSGSTVSVPVLMVPTVSTLTGDITFTFTIDGEDKTTTIDVSNAFTSLKAGSKNIININLGDVPEVSETANCYIIAPNNSLTIPVNVRGNGKGVAGTDIDPEISPLSVGLLWETSEGLITLDDMSSDEKVTITANSESGNALIAAYSGENQTGDILWSWHIWVTDYDPDNGTTYTVTNSAGESYKFMDRNLGATTVTTDAASTFGMFYQWGRKDPFPGSSSVTDEEEPTLYDASGAGSADMIAKEEVSASSNLLNSIQNPLTFYYGTKDNNNDWYSVTAGTHNNALWGGADISAPTEKTIFDPSPAGWRVPTWKSSASPWSEFTKDNFVWSTGNTYTDGSFYPAAGIRNYNSGIITKVGGRGNFWSGSYDNDNDKAYNLYCNKKNVLMDNSGVMALGFSVRCVKE